MKEESMKEILGLIREHRDNTIRLRTHCKSGQKKPNTVFHSKTAGVDFN